MDIKTVTSKYNFSILILRFFAIGIDVLVFFVVFLYLELLFKVKINIKIIIVYFSSIFIYYSLFEGITGYTWGKLVVGIKVLNEDLTVPGFFKGMARSVMKFIEFNPLLLFGIPTMLFVLISKNKQRFGDILTNTYVVRISDLESLNISLKGVNFNKPSLNELKLNKEENKYESVKKLFYRKIIINKIIPIVFSIFFIVTVYKITNYLCIHSQQVLSRYENKYEITLPFGWKESSKLNSDAALQASDEENKNYIIAICEEKQDLIKTLTLKEYSKIVESNIDKTIDNGKIISSTSIKINNYNGIQLEMTGTIDNTKVRYLYVILETKDNFNQIIAWTLDENYKTNKEELLKIIRSFREDEEKLNKNESV